MSKTLWSAVDLFWLSTANRLTDAEARKALAEYRETGGMVDVVMAEPDPSDLSAEHCEALSSAGPSVDEIDWTGFEASLHTSGTLRDEDGNLLGDEGVFSGRSVQEISEALAEAGYDGPSVKVVDEPGFTRGWASATEWRAQ